MTTTKKTKTKPTVTRNKKATPFVVDNLPSRPLVFEVLDLVSRSRSKAKKIATLQKYDDQSLRRILIWNFDESIQSILPEGPVP